MHADLRRIRLLDAYDDVHAIAPSFCHRSDEERASVIPSAIAVKSPIENGRLSKPVWRFRPDNSDTVTRQRNVIGGGGRIRMLRNLAVRCGWKSFSRTQTLADLPIACGERASAVSVTNFAGLLADATASFGQLNTRSSIVSTHEISVGALEHGLQRV
jgi:hypothetical protein